MATTTASSVWSSAEPGGRRTVSGGRRHRRLTIFGRGVTALALMVSLVGWSGPAHAASAPQAPSSPCRHYALVLQHVASADLYDVNGDGWHCSGPLVPRAGGTQPVLYADNRRIPRPRGATKYFAGGSDSGSGPWLRVAPRSNRYAATVSIEEGDGPFTRRFRYDRNDLFYLSYGSRSAVGGSSLVNLRTFERALSAAARSPYYHPVRLDALHTPRRSRSSVFSLYTAPDESPRINDVATLRSGAVTPAGDIRVRLDLTCPKGHPFTASMSTLTISSGAPDDISSSNSESPRTGRCSGVRQTVELLLTTRPIDGVLYPAPRNCSAEYGVAVAGPLRTGGSPRWSIGFDRGGADGGPDGPGPALCLR